MNEGEKRIFIVVRIDYFRSLAEKLSNIQATLDERMMAFHTLSAKHALLEADLAAAKEQNKEAEKKMEKMELDKEQLIHRIRREFKLEKEVDQFLRKESIEMKNKIFLFRN